MASLISGLSIDTLLVVNNYRDIEQDRISKKKTLIVRYGKTFGSLLYLSLGIIAGMMTCYFYFVGIISLSSTLIVPIVYIYLHTITWRKMVGISKGKALNAILGETSRNILIYGLLLTAAIVAGNTNMF